MLYTVWMVTQEAKLLGFLQINILIFKRMVGDTKIKDRQIERFYDFPSFRWTLLNGTVRVSKKH